MGLRRRKKNKKEAQLILERTLATNDKLHLKRILGLQPLTSTNSHIKSGVFAVYYEIHQYHVT